MNDIKEHPTHRILNKTKRGLGWIKDKPGDKYLLKTTDPEIKKFYQHVMRTPLLDEADLREFASPVENQGGIGSCSANAAMGCVELLENRIEGKFVDGSRLFTYKVTRSKIEHVTGDTGATITDTFLALVKFGVCPEELWPYIEEKFDEEPPKSCYEAALDYQTLEQMGLNKLKEIKKFLAAGYPVEIGIFAFESLEQIGKNGIMSLPDLDEEEYLGGHAIAIVGYKKIKGVPYIICRNSWGEEFGDKGYFYMPESFFDMKYEGYSCVDDFRVILKQEYRKSEDTNF